MNWTGEHSLFPLLELIISILISKTKLFNLLVKSFMLSQVFFLPKCILRFSCSSVSIFRVKGLVLHTYSRVLLALTSLQHLPHILAFSQDASWLQRRFTCRSSSHDYR